MKDPVRRFNFVDLMVLIAALAIGMALVRYNTREIIHEFQPRSPREWLQYVYMWALGLVPIPAMLGCGLLAMRLRPPRPTLRRLTARPGFVALVGNALGTVVVVLLTTHIRAVGDGWSAEWLVGLADVGVSMGIWNAWLVLVLSGRWHLHRDVFERGGFLVAGYWMMFIVSETVYKFVARW